MMICLFKGNSWLHFQHGKGANIVLNGDYQHLLQSSSICWQYKRHLCLIVNLLSNICVCMRKHTHTHPHRHTRTRIRTHTKSLGLSEVVGKLPSGRCCALSKSSTSRPSLLFEQSLREHVLWLLLSTLFLVPLITHELRLLVPSLAQLFSMVTVLNLKNKNDVAPKTR